MITISNTASLILLLFTSYASSREMMNGVNGPAGRGGEPNYALRMAHQDMKHVPLNQGYIDEDSMDDDFFEEAETDELKKHTSPSHNIIGDLILDGGVDLTDTNKNIDKKKKIYSNENKKSNNNDIFSDLPPSDKSNGGYSNTVIKVCI